jgi:protein phosphatase
MDSQTVTTLLLVVAVGVIAYLVGERRSAKRELAKAKATADAKPAEAAKSAPSAPPKESPPDPAPPREISISSSDKTPSSGSLISMPPDSGPKVLTVVPQRAEPGPGVVKLDYEEDDEVDPTKVGMAAAQPEAERIIIQPPVKKIVFDDDASNDEPERKDSMFLVSATAQTDRGLRRKRNEDSLGVLESKNLFIVADGMGGYAGGDRASALAVDTVIDAYRSNTFEGAQHENLSREGSELARAIQMANSSVAEEAKKNPKLKDMGTTICAAAFSPNKERLFVGHVGDSRCYRLRDGVFKQVTADHTMAEQGVKGPEGQQLSRAVGIWPTVVIDVVTARPKTGDVYLLCSDGLTKMLNDNIIANVLRNEEDPKAAVERLIFFANSRGGKDNITVVLVRVVPVDWKPKPSEPFRPASMPPPSSDSSPPSKGVRVPPPSSKKLPIP